MGVGFLKNVLLAFIDFIYVLFFSLLIWWIALICFWMLKQPYIPRANHIRRRQWHPTPALLPGKSHERRRVVDCSPWGRWRVWHDWATSLSLFSFMHWRRKWRSTPVVLPGKSQGRGSLVGCHLWGHTIYSHSSLYIC